MRAIALPRYGAPPTPYAAPFHAESQKPGPVGFAAMPVIGLCGPASTLPT
jgi:hypothetical protein